MYFVFSRSERDLYYYDKLNEAIQHINNSIDAGERLPDYSIIKGEQLDLKVTAEDK